MIKIVCDNCKGEFGEEDTHRIFQVREGYGHNDKTRNLHICKKCTDVTIYDVVIGRAKVST